MSNGTLLGITTIVNTVGFNVVCPTVHFLGFTTTVNTTGFNVVCPTANFSVLQLQLTQQDEAV